MGKGFVMTSAKLVGVWIAGGILLLLGSWIINNLKLGPGVSDAQYIFALLLGLAFFLAAGLAWISVAAAARHS